MKKIAVLTCLNSVGGCCTGASCLTAFYNRSGGFLQYQNEELQLAAFFPCNGCKQETKQGEGLEEKIQRILRIKPDAIHLGVCTLKQDGTRCSRIEELTDVFRSNGIPVINGTHNSPRLENIGMPV